jgi:hypothetical protein
VASYIAGTEGCRVEALARSAVAVSCGEPGEVNVFAGRRCSREP